MKITKSFYVSIFFLSISSIIFASPVTATPQPEIAPGEIIVKYKEGQSPEDIKEDVSRRESRGKSLFGRVQNVAENINLRRKGEKPPEQNLSELRLAEQKVGVVAEEKLFEQVDKNVRILKTTTAAQEAKKTYEGLAGIEYAALDYELAPPPMVPNDPFYSRMWNLGLIKADRGWDTTLGTKSILIGSIDTGIDYTHEDLARDIINGHDFGNDDEDSMDTYPHGTQVAGIVNAVINNNKGVVGIAPEIQLLAVNVYGENEFYSAVAQGVVYAAERGAKVIYLEVQSYPGLPCTSLPYLQDAINYSRSKNITIVSAAGNYDSDTSIISPASCSGHIVVGASDRSDQREYYSNWGSDVDIAAPAAGVTTTTPGNTYTDYFNGTSAATPHVAAGAALVLSVNPNLTPDQVENIIKESGDPIFTDKPIGGKRLNVYKAVLAASQSINTPTPTPTPTLTPTPTPIAADINRDGCVGKSDLDIWVNEYKNGFIPTNPLSDINKDGVVNLLDYNEWFVALRTLPREKICSP